MKTCPSCGNETETLQEGYCQECRDNRQNQLDTFNTAYDKWERMTEKEKDQAIRLAANS